MDSEVFICIPLRDMRISDEFREASIELEALLMINSQTGRQTGLRMPMSYYLFRNAKWEGS